jgi:hypothetical protein
MELSMFHGKGEPVRKRATLTLLAAMIDPQQRQLRRI